jgi:tetratricopeptide (TPR) repeat protein
VRLIPDERAGAPSVRLGSHLADLGELLLLQGRFEQAEETLSEGFELLAEQVGHTHWRSSAALGSLGAAMAGQRRYEDAEPLLQESAETLMADDSLSRGQRYLGVELVPTAIQRVVDFYTAWQVAPSEGHEQQAAEWRGRLARWKQEQGN